MNKKIIATAIAASTLGGAAAGATLLAPGFAGAQEGDSPPPAEERVRPDHGQRIAEALHGLIDDGTLTEAQVDAVAEALQEARPERGEGHEGRNRGSRGRGFGEGGADIADILGLDSSAVREAIAGGQTIADLAAEQGVDVQVIVDAIVDAAEERINGAVESGRIDQDKADEILTNAEQHAEDLVNGELERPRHRRGGGNGPGVSQPETA